VKKLSLCALIFLALISLIQASEKPVNTHPADAVVPGLPSLGLRAHPQASPVKADVDFGRMPLYFIANEGQVDGQVAYYIQGQDKTLYFTSEGVTFILSRPNNAKNEPRPLESIERAQEYGKARSEDETGEREAAASASWVTKLNFVGANPDVRPVGVEKTGAVISYFKGNPKNWRTGLSTYSQIVYPDLWPGIDLVYSGTVNRLKYELIVHPGADPSQIRLAYSGVETVRVTEEGRLEVTTPAGSFEDDVPVAFQEVEGECATLSLSYVLDDVAADKTKAAVFDTSQAPDAGPESRMHIYRFEVGEYDRTRPLVLDPAVLVNCGYVGGSADDQGYGIALDASGNAYITGYTYSIETTFPVAVGPDLTHNGNTDAFVAKVNAAGTALVYCGYIGGTSNDASYGIAVDNAGSAYVTGYTGSDQTTFPETVGPDLTHNGGPDAFVAKVNSSGTALVYCGYIGGISTDTGNGIAVDGSGNAYVTGYTSSTQSTFPETVGPDLTHNGNSDGFVAKVNSSGTALIYCGYVGGSGADYGTGIAVDGSGNAYVTGYTDSTQATFPETVGPDLTHNGGQDAFVARLNVAGTALLYCGYIGGSDSDVGLSIAVDSSGSAYITGNTLSTEATFPVSVGPDLTHNGGEDAFVAKVNVPGTALAYCGYIGGSNYEYGRGIAVDISGNAYVTGNTSSSEATFPVKEGPGNLIYNGGTDAFVAKVNPSGMALVYCGYIGGAGADFGYGMAVSGSGNAYVVGYAASDQATFPVLVGPDLTHNGAYDVYVAKVSYWDVWTPKHAVGDFDGDGADEVAVDFGAAGVYIYDNGAWTQMSPDNPESLIAANVDGDSPAEILADFGTTGLWLWNAGAWNQLSGVNADFVSIADLDGSGGEEIVGDFGATGLWIRNAGVWTQLSGVNADYMAFGDTNGMAGQELIGDFGATGLWLWDGGLWTQLSGVNADYMIAGDLDSSGDDEIFGDFAATGLWLWDSGAWTQLSNVNADFMIRADVNGDGDDEVLGDFGALGLWLWNGGSWTQTSGVNPEYIMAGDVDGDNQDEILADFGGLGLWLWNGGAWSQISANNPD
jgi:hypothetical protein